MDVQDMIDDIRRHGFNSTDWTNTEVTAHINDAYFDVLGREPWPFLEVSTTASLTAGQTDINTPTNIDKVIALVDTTNDRVLRHVRIDDIHEDVPSEFDPVKQDKPRYFYFVGDTLKVHPAVDGTTSFRIVYIRKPIELLFNSLEGDVLLPPRHHRVLVLGALIQMYLARDDVELARVFEQQFEKRILSMRDDLWRKTFKADYIRPTYDDFDSDDYVVYGWK